MRELQVVYCAEDRTIADVMTNPLPRATFEEFRSAIVQNRNVGFCQQDLIKLNLCLFTSNHCCPQNGYGALVD